jgi:hypothetical protein
VTHATVGSLEIFHLGFPPSFSHGVIDPATGYIAVVLEGAVHKSFRHSSSTLACGSFMSIPAGAAHSSTFAPDGCRVVIVRAADEDGERLFGSILNECREVVAHASTLLGWKISKELECRDACSRLALEGLALELLASAREEPAPTPESTTQVGYARFATSYTSRHRASCRSTSSGRSSTGIRPTSREPSGRRTA